MPAMGGDVIKYTCSVFLGLFFTQVLFYIIQQNQAVVLRGSVESLFKRESMLVNPYLIGNALSDLESLRTIKCSSLEQLEPKKYIFRNMKYRPGCESNPWLLNSYPIETQLLASNGTLWRLSFESVNPSAFYITLWLIRILISTLILFFLNWHKRELRKSVELKNIEVRYMRNLGELAMQVVHDIRSPLACLKVASASLESVKSDEQDLIQFSIQRINDICFKLLRQGEQYFSTRDVEVTENGNKLKTSAEASSGDRAIYSLGMLLDSAVAEKRLQFSSKVNIHIDFTVDYAAFSAFAFIDSVEFQRIVSNLLDNAIEAEGDGLDIHIGIKVTKNENYCSIEFEDNGKGIEQDVLKLLGQRGASFGKPSGTGLGLYHAKSTLELWGGRVEIKSELKKGTKVTLYFPVSSPPGWFCETIFIKSNHVVGIIDDESWIHSQLKKRLRTFAGEVLSFWSPEEFCDWHRDRKHSDFFLFVDYNFANSNKTGRDLIRELALKENSILITDQYLDNSLIKVCNDEKIKFCPKFALESIPISF